MVPSPVTISVRPEHVDLVDGMCGAGSCGGGWVSLQVGVLLLSILLAVGLIATLRQVSNAGSVVAEERERTQAERDAFASFQRRLSGLEAAHSVPTGEGGAVAIETRRPDGQLDRLQNAYAETIMSVSHYDEEYDEPMEVHMTAELGEEAAAAVFDSSVFSSQIKQILLRQTREAMNRREHLLEVLDQEANRLQGAGDELREVERELDRVETQQNPVGTFNDLARQWDRLDGLESSCRDLLIDHQTTASELPGSIGYDSATIREYLYSELPTRYPVLSDGTRTLRRIRDLRRDTLRALTSRV